MKEFNYLTIILMFTIIVIISFIFIYQSDLANEELGKKFEGSFKAGDKEMNVYVEGDNAIEEGKEIWYNTLLAMLIIFLISSITFLSYHILKNKKKKKKNLS